MARLHSSLPLKRRASWSNRGELIGVLRRTAAPVYGFAVVVAFAIFPALAAAQGSDTVYDEAGALSDPEEQRVQQAFD